MIATIPGLAHLGSTRRRTPVLVNAQVASADLIVSIGCIEPHIIASFGGGYKNLFPGVAGRATIAHNHSLNCDPATFNMVGQPIEKNPMRLDLEEAGQNARTTGVHHQRGPQQRHASRSGRMRGSHSGAPRWRQNQREHFRGRTCLPRLDVVITNSHPMDQDLRQGVKALANTIRAVKRGGVMITLVRAEEGVGVFGLANKRLPLGRSALQTLAPLLLPLVPRLKLKGLGEEDKFFLYFALQGMRHATLLMVAPTIPQEIHERLPFVLFCASPQEALDRAARLAPIQARVLHFLTAAVPILFYNFPAPAGGQGCFCPPASVKKP